MKKADSFAEQKRLIEEKKREVLAKFQNQTARNSEQVRPHFSQKPVTDVQSSTVLTTTNVASAAPQTNLLVNDGNFLARFQEMQKQMKNSNEVLRPNGSTLGPTPGPDPGPGSGLASSKTNNSCSSSQMGKITMKLSGVKKTEPLLQTVTSRPSVFEEPELEPDSTQEDHSKEAAEQLAQNVVKEGVEAEAMARIQYQNNPNYKFLFDTSDPIHKFYQDKLKELQSSNSHSVLGKRKRRNRWGEGPSTSADAQPSTSGTDDTSDAPQDIMAAFERAKAEIQAKANALKSGKETEDRKRQRQIEEQKELEAMYRRILAEQQIKQRAIQQQERSGKPKYEYDSDEEIEGGTWEHKKRKSEMEKTRGKALDLTTKGKGKHFLGDFLPPAELAKFMETFKAKKEGRDPDLSDYAEYKIKQDNIGYQMLQKAGWEEGKGLGSKGTGITQPVNRGAAAFENAGIGVEKPGEVEGSEDAFELYRKRMMLAYKFRPNPLNNPRRPYY